MKKSEIIEVTDDQPIEALVMQFKQDRYKLSYAALRWAKEIKQKENLPDSIPALLPRALREIVTGKVEIKDIQKLPMAVKVAPPPPPPAAPSHPRITLNISAEDDEKSGKGD